MPVFSQNIKYPLEKVEQRLMKLIVTVKSIFPQTSMLSNYCIIMDLMIRDASLRL